MTLLEVVGVEEVGPLAEPLHELRGPGGGTCHANELQVVFHCLLPPKKKFLVFGVKKARAWIIWQLADSYLVLSGSLNELGRFFLRASAVFFYRYCVLEKTPLQKCNKSTRGA
jgi:hypothetical protein